MKGIHLVDHLHVWRTNSIPVMSSCVRKAVDVGDWLGRSVVAEGVSPVRIELLFFGESRGGWWFFVVSYRQLARRTGVGVEEVLVPALSIAQA